MDKETPYFMTNDNWYYYDEIEEKYKLTLEAPKDAIKDYKIYCWEIIYDSYIMYGMRDEIINTLDKLGLYLIYLEEYYSKEKIIEILEKFEKQNLLDSILLEYVKKYYNNEKFDFDKLLCKVNFNIEYLNTNIIFEGEDNAAIKNEANSILNTRIEELDLSTRTYNCLKKYEINNVLDMLNLTYDEIIKFKNLGSKSRKEIKKKQEEIKNKLNNFNSLVEINKINDVSEENFIDEKYTFTFDELLNLNIKELNLSVRSFNGLVQNKITSVGDLIKKSEIDLWKMNNIGQKSVREIVNVIDELKIKLEKLKDIEENESCIKKLSSEIFNDFYPELFGLSQKRTKQILNMLIETEPHINIVVDIERVLLGEKYDFCLETKKMLILQKDKILEKAKFFDEFENEQRDYIDFFEQFK